MHIDEVAESDEFELYFRGRVWAHGEMVFECEENTGADVFREIIGFVMQRAGFADLRSGLHNAVDEFLRRFEP